MVRRTLALMATGALAFAIAGCASSGGDGGMNADDTLRPAASDATPVNDACPIQGAPVSDAYMVNYKGAAIGFCCDRCKQAFIEMDEAARDEAVADAR